MLSGCALAVMQVPREKVGSYGAVSAEATKILNTYRIRRLVENPPQEEARSTLRVCWRVCFAYWRL